MAQHNADWIEWAGGICPVDTDTMIEYRIRFGPDDAFSCKAGFCRWDHGRTPESAADESRRRNDIIAYRVVPA